MKHFIHHLCLGCSDSYASAKRIPPYLGGKQREGRVKEPTASACQDFGIVGHGRLHRVRQSLGPNVLRQQDHQRCATMTRSKREERMPGQLGQPWSPLFPCGWADWWGPRCRSTSRTCHQRGALSVCFLFLVLPYIALLSLSRGGRGHRHLEKPRTRLEETSVERQLGHASKYADCTTKPFSLLAGSG